MAARINNAEERQLLGEIGETARRVKMLRAAASRDVIPIKALEGELRAKWAALRLLRAGPGAVDLHAPRSRSLYR